MGFFMLARLAKKAFKAVSEMNSGITNGASGGFCFRGFFFTGVSTAESKSSTVSFPPWGVRGVRGVKIEIDLKMKNENPKI